MRREDRSEDEKVSIEPNDLVLVICVWKKEDSMVMTESSFAVRVCEDGVSQREKPGKELKDGWK